jgi:hypothetical protein
MNSFAGGDPQSLARGEMRVTKQACSSCAAIVRHEDSVPEQYVLAFIFHSHFDPV